MSRRFFLDTNVFVCTFDSGAAAKAKRAASLIRKAVHTGEGVVGSQVVQEFFNLALRRFAQPLSVAEAEQFLVTVFRPLLANHSSNALYMEGLRIAGRHRLRWFDSLIVAAALESQCRVPYSEKLQHGQEIEGLRVENPFR